MLGYITDLIKNYHTKYILGHSFLNLLEIKLNDLKYRKNLNYYIIIYAKVVAHIQLKQRF